MNSSFNHSMELLVQAFLDSAAEMLKLPDEQMSSLAECFLFKLPDYPRGSLLISYVDIFSCFFPLPDYLIIGKKHCVSAYEALTSTFAGNAQIVLRQAGGL